MVGRQNYVVPSNKVARRRWGPGALIRLSPQLARSRLPTEREVWAEPSAAAQGANPERQAEPRGAARY